MKIISLFKKLPQPDLSSFPFVFTALIMLGVLAFGGNLENWRRLFHTTPVTERVTSFVEDWHADALPFPMAPLELFAFPDRTCAISDYGAIPNDELSDTQAFTRAVKECADQGGGTVSVPPGSWLTGPIHLESMIRLNLAKGAIIRFSRDVNDYLPPVFSRYEGMEYYGYSPLIYGSDCHDVAITGQGLLEGEGDAWWDWKKWQQQGAKKLYAMTDANLPVEERVFDTPTTGLRPSFVQFVRCSRIALEDFTIKNGPMWTLHPLYSNDVLIRNLTVITDGPNNDGIVLDSSKNILVEDVHLDTADDAIVIKSGTDKGGRRVGRPSENIVIRRSSVGRGNGGVVIGSEMSGGVRNVFVSQCTFDGTKRGLRIKSTPNRGGIVENIWFQDIDMHNIEAEAIFLNMYYDSKNIVHSAAEFPATFRNFIFKNITSTQSLAPIVVVGADNSPIHNLSFTDISLQSQTGIELRNAEDVHFEKVDIASRQPSLLLENIRRARFDHRSESPHLPRTLITVMGSRSEDITFDASYQNAIIRTEKNTPQSAVIRETASLSRD